MRLSHAIRELADWGFEVVRMRRRDDSLGEP